MSGKQGTGRLVAAGAVAVAGAAVCLGAARLTWIEGSSRAVRFPAGGGATAAIPVAGPDVSGSDVGAGLAVLASFLVASSVVIALLTRPRLRRTAFGLATAFAGVALGVSVTAAATAAKRAAELGVASPHVRPAPVVLTIVAAAVAVAGTIAAMWSARSAAAVRLPEGAPSDG